MCGGVEGWRGRREFDGDTVHFSPPECFVPQYIRVTGPDEKTDMVRCRTVCLHQFVYREFLPQIAALLCVGLYPNVCFHKEKRRLLTSEGKSALIHKSSVNLINKEPHFSSPYFVFGEKVLTLMYGRRSLSCFISISPSSLPLRSLLPPSSLPPPSPQLKTRAVSAKTMTMVEPIQLLLFGPSSVVAHPGSIVKMDDW